MKRRAPLEVAWTDFPRTPSIQLVSVEAFVFRAPLQDTVQTSFGVMRDRPAVLVRLVDRDGVAGWGEIWCNFPAVGAEHRARLLESCVAPVLLEREWQHPAEAFFEINRRLEVLAIQTGEPGPLAQAAAGADVAFWDLASRKLGQPLWRLFDATPEIEVYASGLNPGNALALAEQKLTEGYRAFKLKLGFDEEQDIRNMADLRGLLGAERPIMMDANQAWDVPTAIHMCRRLVDFAPTWMEEPIRADSSVQAWRELAQAVSVALAGGENLRGLLSFQSVIEDGLLDVIQPDLGKWGGFSGCVPVARAAAAHGKQLCPHWLGGGVGLVAAMHLKAIAGGLAYVEVDANPNPLRSLFAEHFLSPVDGKIALSDAPGLGISPDLALAEPYLVLRCCAGKSP